MILLLAKQKENKFSNQDPMENQFYQSNIHEEFKVTSILEKNILPYH